MPSPILRASLAVAVGVALAAAATAQEIRPDDIARLNAFDAVAGRTLLGAFAEGAPEDLAVLSDALAGAALPPDEALALLPGAWSCRTIKMGGGLPLVVYPPFRCRADADGGFEKLSGSQRTKGAVSLRDGRPVYLGTGFVAGETPPDYTDLPDRTDPASVPQFMPEVGIVEVTGPGAARILFPQPYLESHLNLLVLRR